MTLAELTGTVMADAGVKTYGEATPEHWRQLLAAWNTVMNRLLNHRIGAAIATCPAINYRSDWKQTEPVPVDSLVQPADTREIPKVLLPETVLLPLLRFELKEKAPLWAGVDVDLGDVGKAEGVLK